MITPVCIHTGHFIPTGVTAPFKCRSIPATYHECYYPERKGVQVGYTELKSIFDEWLSNRQQNPNVSLWIATEDTRLINWTLEQLEKLKLTSLVCVILHTRKSRTEYPVDEAGVVRGGWPYGCLDVTPDDLTGILAPLSKRRKITRTTTTE